MPPAPGTMVATKPCFFTAAQSSGLTRSSPRIPILAAVAACCSTSIPVLRKQPRQMDCLIRPFLTIFVISSALAISSARVETVVNTEAAPARPAARVSIARRFKDLSWLFFIVLTLSVRDAANRRETHCLQPARPMEPFPFCQIRQGGLG